MEKNGFSNSVVSFFCKNYPCTFLKIFTYAQNRSKTIMYNSCVILSLVFYFLLLSLCLSQLLHEHSHTSPTIFLYSFIKSFFLHLRTFCHNAAGWQRTDALVSLRQLSASAVLTQWRVTKKPSSKASNWNHTGKRLKTRQRRLRQIQRAWRVCEKGAGGSRDEHRQASQQSAALLTPMQLDSRFYQH